MRNFAIHFSQPWLLLLFIPAIVLTLLPYFLLKKRYRKTRNRIISMILHGIVMTLAILVLAGINFTYQIPNYQNEIILLVDVSDTERESTDEESTRALDDFILTVLDEAQYDGYQVGIVTFGFDQVEAVPLTHKLDTVYDLYKAAPLPDTSATDIAAALRFTRDRFSKPETAKIVLLTDGKETDESAMSVIRSISAQGTQVDTVYFSSEFGTDNVQIVGVEYPTYHVNLNEVCTIEVLVNAREAAEEAIIEIFDNGDFDPENGTQTLPLAQGTQAVEFSAIFETEGLHEITVKVTEASDGLEGNNIYYSYYYLEVYNQVLIIDQGVNDGESDALEAILTEGDEPFQVAQLHLSGGDPDQEIPTTVDELRKYDQIILNNVSNADLPLGFDELLYSYVYEYGGGLFTTGGSNSDATPHAYNRDDLRYTLLQEMLPVEAIDYTPPVGVVIIIDVSGSMGGEKLNWAKNGAVTCLDALTSRDYVGIMTLSNDYGTVLPLTRRTEETRIKEAINSVFIQGSTNFTGAIDRASRMLISESRIDRRHIIIVTDGAPTEPENNYLPIVAQNYWENGITISVVGIELTQGSASGLRMETLVDEEHGNGHVYYAQSEQQIITGLQRDLNAEEIKDYNPEPFYPTVSNVLSPVVNGVEYSSSNRALEVQLDGFYGVHARDSADVVLIGEYEVPIYAQWKYGKGMVGSFMCDVSGEWSAEFLENEGGKRILRNIVSTLMPTQNIRPNNIRLDLRGENYLNELSVYTTLGEGEYITGTVTYTEDDEEIVVSLNELPETTEGLSCYTTLALGASNRYTRANFVIKRGGTYHIVINKYDAKGNLIGTAELYKSFAYSKEYDVSSVESDIEAEALLATLADRGNGVVVDRNDPWGIFNNFVTAIDRLYDPRLPLIIVAIVLFLLDVAVRKFKFKWPHELIRESKQRRGTKQ